MAPSSAERGSSSSHPQGWFYGKLPSFGTCGGRRGSLTMIWEIWGGEGPGKVTGVASGWNLRQHGDTTVKEQEMWGSTSNYGRYLQAGRYMDNKIASIKVSGVDFWFGHGPRRFLACILADLFFLTAHGVFGSVIQPRKDMFAAPALPSSSVDALVCTCQPILLRPACQWYRLTYVPLPT